MRTREIGEVGLPDLDLARQVAWFLIRASRDETNGNGKGMYQRLYLPSRVYPDLKISAKTKIAEHSLYIGLRISDEEYPSNAMCFDVTDLEYSGITATNDSPNATDTMEFLYNLTTAADMAHFLIFLDGIDIGEEEMTLLKLGLQQNDRWQEHRDSGTRSFTYHTLPPQVGVSEPLLLPQF